MLSYTGDQKSHSGLETHNAEGDQNDRQTKDDRQEEEDERQRHFDEQPDSRKEKSTGDGETDPEQKTDHSKNNQTKQK